MTSALILYLDSENYIIKILKTKLKVLNYGNK